MGSGVCWAKEMRPRARIKAMSKMIRFIRRSIAVKGTGPKGPVPSRGSFSFLQQRPATEAHVFRNRTPLTDPNSTVLELRNLSKRVQHWIGQGVRRRFVVTERHKYGTKWRSVISPRVQRDLSTSGLDADDSSR